MHFTMKIKNIRNMIQGLKPTILMVIAETILSANNILFKLASNDGSDLRVLAAYRFLCAAAFLVPAAFFVERNRRLKLTWMVFWLSLLSAFVGSLSHILFVGSLALTSATFTTAITNLGTAFTFILAICFRQEKLNWDKASGKAKVMGTLSSLAGAMVLTFYKGPNIINWNTHLNVGNHRDHHGGLKVPTHQNMILGACSALACITSNSLWMIIQAKTVEHYPCPYSSTALMVTMLSIQCTLYSLCVQRDWSQWKLGWDIRLLTIVYSGVMTTGVMFTLITWCLRMRGPLFVSAFNPLMVVMVALVGALVLNETLHLGSMLGGIIIICGLYVLLWGKAKELKGMAQSPETSSKDSIKPVKIVLATSSSGASENYKDVVHNNDTLNEVTMQSASMAAANTDEEPDENIIAEDQVN